jgi:hypothetical protein
MNPQHHALFQQYPLAGSAVVSTGKLPTPYHVYDGHGVFIGGTADLGAVRTLLAPENVVPVQTESGHALMGVWVCDFTHASLGAHHELQFSLFVSHAPLAPVSAHPLGLIRLMLARPDVKMLCHGLWNNTPDAVAYNRELLALAARQSESRIERDAVTLDFAVRDVEAGTPVLAGRIVRPQRPSWRVNLTLVAQLGLRRLRALAKLPWLRMQILNPVSSRLARNASADSFTKYDSSIVRYFDRARDRLDFGATPYACLGFRPQFGQTMNGFKFVYLSPQ